MLTPGVYGKISFLNCSKNLPYTSNNSSGSTSQSIRTDWLQTSKGKKRIPFTEELNHLKTIKSLASTSCNLLTTQLRSLAGDLLIAYTDTCTRCWSSGNFSYCAQTHCTLLPVAWDAFFEDYIQSHQRSLLLYATDTGIAVFQLYPGRAARYIHGALPIVPSSFFPRSPKCFSLFGFTLSFPGTSQTQLLTPLQPTDPCLLWGDALLIKVMHVKESSSQISADARKKEEFKKKEEEKKETTKKSEEFLFPTQEFPRNSNEERLCSASLTPNFRGTAKAGHRPLFDLFKFFLTFSFFFPPLRRHVLVHLQKG